MKLPHGRTFYVMRHAETEDNVSKIVSGSQSLTNLTNNGREQALAMYFVVAKIKPLVDCVIISEMQRTKDTAKLCCPDQPHIVDSRINERLYGMAEGMSNADREALKAVGIEISGQESKENLLARTVTSVAENLSKYQNPLFITHGGNIRRLLEATIGKEKIAENDEYVTNCMLCEFIAPQKNDGGWVVNILTIGDNNEINRRVFGEKNV